jgi:hypothetical protein
MSLFKTGIAASGIVLALVSSAFAQGALGTAIVVDRSGNAKSVQVNERGHGMMMRHAHPLRPGTIVFMSGGHLYMTRSMAMAQAAYDQGICCGNALP